MVASCLAAGMVLQPAWLAVQAQSAPVEHRDITVAGSHLTLLIPQGRFASPGLLEEWARRSASIVARYFGRFPVPDVRVAVIPVQGDRVAGGTTFGQPQPFIRVRVGQQVDAPALVNDWVLVHEMTHLALPDVGEQHAWLAEGLAVYIEGVARVQSGNRSVEDVFAEEERSMPRAMAGSGGLDQDHSHARTYWGGAVFCLLADVRIHQRTHNRLGLQDAMTAVLKASGGLTSDWDIGKVFATADAAVGVPVMSELYAEMKDRPFVPDLPALWRSLGVEPDADGVRLNDEAPLAAVRKAIFRSR